MSGAKLEIRKVQPEMRKLSSEQLAAAVIALNNKIRRDKSPSL